MSKESSRGSQYEAKLIDKKRFGKMMEDFARLKNEDVDRGDQRKIAERLIIQGDVNALAARRELFNKIDDQEWERLLGQAGRIMEKSFGAPESSPLKTFEAIHPFEQSPDDELSDEEYERNSSDVAA